MDGSVISVGIDRDIEIPCWGYTDPQFPQDSVTFMHNPLASDDLIITARTGGFFPGDHVGLWDDRSFLNPDLNSPAPGFTSQSMLGFAYLTDPRSPENFFFFTDGAFHMICTYTMHTSADPALIGQTICPFQQGRNPANGGLLWGMQDGITGVIPEQTYSCLFFSPNADPVWTVFPTGPVFGDAGIEVCFALAGTDADDLNDLHIIQVSGPGAFTETIGGPGGNAAGNWCGTLAAGNYTVGFVLDDGTVQVPLEVRVVVGEIGLEIGCVVAFPGQDAWVPVYLHTAVLLTGGFELLVFADPTALSLFDIWWTPRINNGDEYHQWVADPVGPGTDRFVWIANINNGIYTPPAAAGDDPILWLQYHVSADIPFGMEIPIEFQVNDYTDNTISDETGYLFIHPLLTSGCVRVQNPESYKGDPNMNGFFYEIADAVLVARRLIEGYGVWIINPPVQEGAADLNNNGFADIADLVRFINIINGFIMPPKLDPASGEATITMNDGTVMINSGLEVGGAVVQINHTGEISNVVPAPGMEVLTNDANGVLSVVVYSMSGHRIPAGQSTLFSFQGEAQGFGEVSAADSYGRLMDASAHLVAPLPTSYAVEQNYPNPFNAKTEIRFALPVSSDVSINIYSVTGQLVESLTGHYEAGFNSVIWDASQVASGVYFYKLSAGEFSQTMKATLLK